MTLMSAGTTEVRRGQRHRKVIPYIVVAVVAVLVAAVSWVFAWRSQPTNFPVSCSLGVAGAPVSSTTLVGEHVVPPSEVRVRVYNANGEVGQATTVAEQLRNLGFVPDEEIPYGNDPLVESQDLGCFGQLRFGLDFNGHAAALHALFPCFELIHDERPDSTVDVALGKGFKDLDANSQVEETMAALNRGEQADIEGLSNLRSSTCS